jgi:hypothetical protein
MYRNAIYKNSLQFPTVRPADPLAAPALPSIAEDTADSHQTVASFDSAESVGLKEDSGSGNTENAASVSKRLLVKVINTPAKLSERLGIKGCLGNASGTRTTLSPDSKQPPDGDAETMDIDEVNMD